MSKPLPVVVLGAGAAGLFAAWRLRSHGLPVLLLEARPRGGGLLDWIEVGGTPLELFYHHLFIRDHLLLDALRRVAVPVDWAVTRTGFVGPRRAEIGEFSAPWQLATFSHLRRRERAQMAALLGRISLQWTRSQPAALDRIPALEWLRDVGGGPLIEPFFGPLIEKKFGARAPEISAAWLVGRLGMRAGRTWQGEKLGYPRGGFPAFVQAMERVLGHRGVELRYGEPAQALLLDGDRVAAVRTPSGEIPCRAVLSTAPPSATAGLLRGSGLPGAAACFEALPLQRALTVMLGLERPVSPFYWINVLERGVPFGSIIEHTRFRPAADYGGPTLYLASYPDPDDPILGLGDAAVVDRFMGHLRRLLPGARDNGLRWSRVVKGEEASLEYVCGLHGRLPPAREPTVEGLFYAGMFRCYPKRPVDLVGQDACSSADLLASSLGLAAPAPGPIRSLEP
jgi:protoporphyrinogen oxidase